MKTEWLSKSGLCPLSPAPRRLEASGASWVFSAFWRIVPLVLPPELGLFPLPASGLALAGCGPHARGLASPSPRAQPSRSLPAPPESTPRLPAGGWCWATQADQQKQRPLMAAVCRAETCPAEPWLPELESQAAAAVQAASFQCCVLHKPMVTSRGRCCPRVRAVASTRKWSTFHCSGW